MKHIQLLLIAALLTIAGSAQCDIPDPSDLSITSFDMSDQIFCFVGCAIGFDTPGLDEGAYCITWDFGNGGYAVTTSGAEVFTCYNESGSYPVTLILTCCDYPDEFLVYTHEIIVNCWGDPECALPPSSSFSTTIDTFFSPNIICWGCSAEACGDVLFSDLPADFPFSPELMCMDIEFSNGEIFEGVPLGECRTSCFDMAAEGYVCYTVYCCSNPENSFTFCENFTLCSVSDIPGCTYGTADNYDPDATIDDGTCILTCESDCESDLNADGSVTVADILIILTQFGVICE